MAWRPRRLCSCGKIVSTGELCTCQIARKAEHDRRRPSASDRGYDNRWQKARIAFLQKHPCCVMCGKPATVVNHKIPHLGNKALFWDSKNWEPACKRCHDGPIQAMERRNGLR
jgi:5-methylcytosine-specific restriction endonuclease McrA